MSRDAEQIIADAIHVCERIPCPNNWAGDHCVRRSEAVGAARRILPALRAAGLLPGPDSERIRELETENERLRENWADLGQRVEDAVYGLRHTTGVDAARLEAKAQGVELVRDYMRSYR